MWNQLQDLTPRLSSYWSSYHHPLQYFNISLKSLLCEFSHCIFHQPLIIHFLVNDLLLPKFIQARHTGKGIWTKNNLFDLVMVPLMASSSSSFVFIQFWHGIFNVFASSNSDAPGKLQNFFSLLLTPRKIHHHHHSARALLVFCIGVFTLFNTYLIPNLFISRHSPFCLTDTP